MIPIILVSDNNKETEKFLKELIKKEGFLEKDIFEIKPQEEEITIDQIRELKKSIKYISNKKVFVIFSFDSTGQEAQNALLKTLEEKTDNNQFVLIVQNPRRIIPTIISRSKLIFNKLKNQSQVNKFTDIIKFVEKTKNYGFLGESLILKIDRDVSLRFVDELLAYYDTKLKINGINCAKILNEIIKTRELIKTNNLNPQLAIDNLLIFIFHQYKINNRYEKRLYPD